MKLQDFMEELRASGSQQVMFEYEEGKTVPVQYHVTEVKNTAFDSVDCGGNINKEQQVVIQLWYSDLEKKEKALSAEKILSIIERVEAKLPLYKDAEVVFEYGSPEIRTSHYKIQKISRKEEVLEVKLYSEATQCKPLSLKSLKGCC